nr:hypothetical protein [uncultured Mediterranean phage uvMED]
MSNHNEKIKNVEFEVDLDKFTSGDKQLVREITDILDRNPTTRQLAESLRQKYNIDEAEILPIENSSWDNFSKSYNLGDQVAGFTQVFSKGKRTRVPFLNFSADLRTLNTFVEDVFDKGYQAAKREVEKTEDK